MYFGAAQTFHIYKDTSLDVPDEEENGVAANQRNWAHQNGESLMSATLVSRGYISGKVDFNIWAHEDDKKYKVGRIVCDSWFRPTVHIHDVGGNYHGNAFFANSRPGSLMELHASLPERAPVDVARLAAFIRECSHLIPDVCQVVAEFLEDDMYLTHKLKPNSVKSCGGQPLQPFTGKDCAYTEYINEKPGWNQAMQAFTLEFGGRAAIPSVHNFQLMIPQPEPEPTENDPDPAEPTKRVLMQVGKLGMYKNKVYFNVDTANLSLFHTFALALVVIQRTLTDE